MAEDVEDVPSRSPEADTRPAAPRPAPTEFVQLTLDATITGPRMRTEDHYEPGTELRVKGERGTFTYKYASISRDGLVSLHLLGDHAFRAVRPDQVALVRKSRRRK
jgi:hypothetical protein